MDNQSFTTTLLVDQFPGVVFNAINNVSGWWSQEVQGGTEKLNDVFDYRYKDVHRCKIKLVEVVPDQKVVWLVMENHFNFTQDKSEWKDTNIIFEISRKGKQTELRFTHLGLVPEYECYNLCKDGWSHYINGSLYNLITTGQGQPNAREGGFNQQLIEKYTDGNKVS